MADIPTQPIIELPTKTSAQMTATDKFLGIDSAEGYQTLITDLGDYIIQRVSSNLAGTNQTLATAISALNSNLIPHKITSGMQIASGTDIDTLLEPNTYVCPNGATAETLIHWPEGVAGGRLEIISVLRTMGVTSAERLRYIVYPNNSTRVIARYWNGTSFSDWEEQPTRAEMDAVNNRNPETTIKKYTANNNGTVAIPVVSGTRGVIIFSGVSIGGRGIYSYGVNSSGAVSGSWFINANDVTITLDTNVITVANNSETLVTGIVMA